MIIIHAMQLNFNVSYLFIYFVKNKFYLILKIIYYKSFKSIIIGDWGLGIGDWGLGPIPNPQSPIPNPQIVINLF